MHRYPDISEFKLFFATYKVIKTFGKRKVFQAWSEFMTDEMKDVVKTRDDASFLQSDFTLPRSFSMCDGCLPVLRQLWLTMDAHTKDAIWRHLDNLLSLAKQCGP
jgi:hypothetical protein